MPGIDPIRNYEGLYCFHSKTYKTLFNISACMASVLHQPASQAPANCCTQSDTASFSYCTKVHLFGVYLCLFFEMWLFPHIMKSIYPISRQPKLMERIIPTWPFVDPCREILFSISSRAQGQLFTGSAELSNQLPYFSPR